MLTSALLSAVFFLATASGNTVYARDCHVEMLDYINDVYAVVDDYTGDVFEFSDIEDLEIDSHVMLILTDNGTPGDPTDDTCIDQIWR